MTVLLPTDQVIVWDPQAEPDAHGWAEEANPVQVWAGAASVQETPPAASDQANEEGGGAGPLDPAHDRLALCYLPTSAVIAPGFVVEARGLEWVVRRIHQVADPSGLGLDCLVADLVERREVL